jgi:branched-chain amino acid transport system permease protein
MSSEWANATVGALSTAAMYGLVAAGFVVLFRATKVLSFAQGSFMLIGSLLFYSFVKSAGLPLYPALILALLASGVAGWLTYRFIFAYMVGVEPFVVAIATLGLSAALQAAAYIIWGTSPLTLPNVLSTRTHNLLGTFNVTAIDIFAVLLAVVLGLLVALGMRYSRLGIQMRATADGQQLAAYTGIHVTRISALAWGVGAAFAGAGGIVYALTNNLNPSSVPTVGLAVFPAIILGGLDSYYGAFIGALLVGALDSVIGVTLGGEWQDPIAYVVLLVVLLIRPRGLFGSREIVRI